MTRLGRLTSAVLAVTFSGACDTCPFAIFQRHDSGLKTVECCDAVVAHNFSVPYDDAEVDLSVAGGPQIEGWLTADTCDRLFDTGSSAPRCDILIGPVAAGTVSARRKGPRGSLRIWVRQRNPVDAPVPYAVEAGVWRHHCGIPR